MAAHFHLILNLNVNSFSEKKYFFFGFSFHNCVFLDILTAQINLHLFHQAKSKQQGRRAPNTPKPNRVSTARQEGREKEEAVRREVQEEVLREAVRETVQQKDAGERGRARQRSPSAPPRERRASSVAGRALPNTSPRKGRGRDLSYHGAPLDSSLLLSARHLASRPPRPRTSQSVAPPPLPAQRPVRRPTTASEKKSAARLAAAAREEPPTREALALPAWTAQDLESEGTEETEVTGVTDTLKLQEEPARGPGRLQVNLSGFPRQSIRLSADQAAGVTGLSIMLSQAVALPGAVEEHGSLQLEIEAPEVAAVHRPLALHGGQELRISN